MNNNMIDEIELFRSMIKHHATMIGWLIKNKKVEKLDDKLVLYTQKEVKPQYIQTYKGGISINRWDENFTEINLRNGSFNELIAEGFEIFNYSNSREGLCLTSQIGKILVHHYDILGDIWFPDGFPRLKGEEAMAYIKWLESKHDYLREHDYNFTLNVSVQGYIGLSGFSYYQPKIIENIKKFGIFAYKPLYKQIEWTFELVEKYKDQIVWERLMDDSNLIWEEEMLVKYDKYIPYQKYENAPDYPYDDNSSRRLEDYDHFGFLSNTFLHEHIDVLDWEKVLERCKFSWNKEELDYFCRYVLNHDEKYTSPDIFNGRYGRPTYDVEAILGNEYFNWDAEKLYAYLQLHDDFWNSIPGYKRLHKIFMQIPNVKELAQPHVKDEKFWDIVSYNHDFDYDELSKEFTIDNIKKNLKDWSTPIKNKFIGMQRTPDTNYSFYWVITKWDEMHTHKNIPLTYELAKYLQSIDITIGGTYCESDGGYVEEDHRNQVWNGLKFFTGHHIESEEDMIKIINDIELLDSFLTLDNTCNLDILSYMMKVFFNKTSLQEYLDIVNQMKDWDIIREFKD